MDLCPVCLEAGVEPCTERGRLYNPSCIGQFLALHEQIIKTTSDSISDVAGQIDAIFKQVDETFGLWDWKRSKLLRYDSRSQMKEPLDHFPNVNAWHYFLQLSIHRHILQEDYGVPVSSMCLGVFNPSRSQPLYVRVPLMDDEMQLLFGVSLFQRLSCANVHVVILAQAWRIS